MSVPSLYEGRWLNNQPARGRSFDDSEPYLAAANKSTNRSRGLPENTNHLKSFSGDKERANNVAKIKVVVCLVSSCCRVWFLLFQCFLCD